uniref:Secreted protein n=1 Tax=Plectus sambesii TaxID=2011161 RepID=A0A914WJY2_9BILA
MERPSTAFPPPCVCLPTAAFAVVVSFAMSSTLTQQVRRSPHDITARRLTPPTLPSVVFTCWLATAVCALRPTAPTNESAQSNRRPIESGHKATTRRGRLV